MKKISKSIRRLREYLQGGPKFKCRSGCYECCTGIFFTPEEKKRINNLLRAKGYKEPPRGKGGDYCEYLGPDGRCSVYEERPIVCRAFGKVRNPFTTCIYFKDQATLPDIPSLSKYNNSPDMLHNTHEGGEQWINDVKAGKPDALMAYLYQVLTLIKNNMVSVEEGMKRVEHIESRLNEQGKSIDNYKPGMLSQLRNTLT